MEDRIAEYLMTHSNAGTFHTMDSARHFFLTRFMYEGLANDAVTEAQYNLLAEEAWSLFVLPAIQSFHTWLKDIIPASPEMEESLEEVLAAAYSDWIEEMTSYKSQLLENLA